MAIFVDDYVGILGIVHAAFTKGYAIVRRNVMRIVLPIESMRIGLHLPIEERLVNPNDCTYR